MSEGTIQPTIYKRLRGPPGLPNVFPSLAARSVKEVSKGQTNLKNCRESGTEKVPQRTFLATGKYGCRKVRVYPAECGEQLGRDPSKKGSSKSLVLKSFSGEGTLWDSSLPVTLTPWDTPVLCTPPLPLSQLLRQRSRRTFG